MFRKKDVLLIFLLAAVAVGAFLLLPAFRPPPPEKEAEGEPLYVRYRIGKEPGVTLPLTQETDLSIDQGDGVVNVLHLTPDGFVMASSTCYNQQCVHQGEVNRDNSETRPLLNMIVCMPHRLVVELLTAQEAEGQAHE